MTSLQVPPAVSRRTRPLLRATVTLVATAGALLLGATVASANDPGTGRLVQDSGEGLTVVQTLLLYIAAPAVIFGIIVLLVVGPSIGKGPRHRTGAALETGPIWVDPSGVQRTPADAVVPDGPGAPQQGGSSAHW